MAEELLSPRELRAQARQYRSTPTDDPARERRFLVAQEVEKLAAAPDGELGAARRALAGAS